MTRRVTVAAAVLAGVLAGAAFALLHGQRAPARVPVVGAKATGYGWPGLQLGRPLRVRVAVRRRDPAGGPDWAVRTWDTTEVDYPRNGLDHCAQLGRLVGGRFVWLIAGRSPQRVRFSTMADAPTMCGSVLGRGGEAMVQQIMVLGRGGAEPGTPLTTVTWGRLGRMLTGESYSDGVRLTPAADQGVLDVRAGGLPSWTTGIAVYRDGHRRLFHHAQGSGRTLANAVVVARAPDPAGGPPWGVIRPLGARADCLIGPGRLVGRRLGILNTGLGIFVPDLLPAGAAGPDPTGSFSTDDVATLEGDFLPISGHCPRRQSAPDASHPARLQIDVSFLHDEDPVSRVQLRQPDGRTIVVGRTTSRVRTLTISTPGGSRTLIPEGPAHTVLLVAPGTSPSGRFDVAAHLKDGHNIFWPLYSATH